MTTNETPRVRSLLRQANRNVEAGKLAAAEELYEQIIAESPQSAAAWLGLSNVVRDEARKSEAYSKALAIDPHVVDEDDAAAAEDPAAGDDSSANQADAASRYSGAEALMPAQPDRVSEKAAAGGTKTLPDEGRQHRYEVLDPDVQLFCYRHPDRSTSLRCYKCNKPICSECTVKTPVGYLCPDCYREAEDAFFNANPTDYIIAAAVALPISLVAGWLVMRFSSGLFFIIIMFFIGGAVGGVIGRVTKRFIGGRRGRYIPHLVAACVIIGVLVWALPVLIGALLVNPRMFFSLIGPGVYLATAVGSAYFWAR